MDGQSSPHAAQKGGALEVGSAADSTTKHPDPVPVIKKKHAFVAPIFFVCVL